MPETPLQIRPLKRVNVSAVSTGDTNANRPSAQNGVPTKPVVLQRRHRAIVEGGAPSASSWRIATAVPALARVALTTIMIAAV
jgi:hypothetical protein